MIDTRVNHVKPMKARVNMLECAISLGVDMARVKQLYAWEAGHVFTGMEQYETIWEIFLKTDLAKVLPTATEDSSSFWSTSRPSNERKNAL